MINTGIIIIIYYTNSIIKWNWPLVPVYPEHSVLVSLSLTKSQYGGGESSYVVRKYVYRDQVHVVIVPSNMIVIVEFLWLKPNRL